MSIEQFGNWEDSVHVMYVCDVSMFDKGMDAQISGADKNQWRGQDLENKRGLVCFSAAS